jgi:hypothetical protein
VTEITYERAVDLLEAELGDERVALSLENGHCFGFNSVAATVWQALERPRRFDDLKATLLAEYEVGADECAGQLQKLLDEFIAMNLVSARRTAQ